MHLKVEGVLFFRFFCLVSFLFSFVHSIRFNIRFASLRFCLIWFLLECIFLKSLVCNDFCLCLCCCCCLLSLCIGWLCINYKRIDYCLLLLLFVIVACHTLCVFECVFVPSLIKTKKEIIKRTTGCCSCRIIIIIVNIIMQSL